MASHTDAAASAAAQAEAAAAEGDSGASRRRKEEAVKSSTAWLKELFEKKQEVRVPPPLALREKKGGFGHGMALTVSTGKWEVQAWSKRFPNAAANPGKALLNVGISALYDADSDVVAPHGLVGQSYDGDDEAIDPQVLDELKVKV